MTLNKVSALVTLGAWVASSSALIFANKALYSQGFSFPLTTTAIGQAASFLCGLALAQLAAPGEEVGSLKMASIGVLALTVAATVGTLYLGNAAYMTMSVAFIQMLKGFTPGLTLVIAIASGREQRTLALFVAVAAICLGTAISSVSETATSHFSRTGFSLMLLSSVCEALRTVAVQHLTTSQARGLTLGQAMVFISLPSAICLAALSAGFERQAWSVMLDLQWLSQFLLLAVGGLSATTNLTGYAAIQARCPSHHI
jgi:drug/metabolite transporter (DMT)-like permease